MTACDCIRCKLAPYVLEAYDRQLEEVINSNDPIIMNESNVKRKNNFREFIRNK